MEEFFSFKLNQIKIFKNREVGSAEIKILSLVTSNYSDFSNFHRLKSVSDTNEQKTIIKSTVESILSSRQLIPVENIKDGHKLFFGDEGYSLYRANKIPDFFDWSLLVIESDKDIRQLGDEIDSIVDTDDFEDLTSTILTLVTTAANPTAGAGAVITRFIIKQVSALLKKNSDDQVGLLYKSFNRFEHYPHGEYKKDDQPDLSNNIRVDYSIFGVKY